MKFLSNGLSLSINTPMGSVYDGPISYSYSFTDPTDFEGRVRSPWPKWKSRVFTCQGFSQGLGSLLNFSPLSPLPRTPRPRSLKQIEWFHFMFEAYPSFYIITRGWLLQFSARTQNSTVFPLSFFPLSDNLALSSITRQLLLDWDFLIFSLIFCTPL